MTAGRRFSIGLWSPGRAVGPDVFPRGDDLAPRRPDRYHPGLERTGFCKLLETAPIDGLTVRRRLAVGGMAELFLADQEVPGGGDRPVVLKRALPGADGEMVGLLGRERDVLRGLDSPWIVQLLGGRDDWLLLEYVDGPDLAALTAHWAKRGRPLPIRAALAAIEGLARGLGALHRAGGDLVHRDVNPANVLVRASDGAVKLTDLGVVHIGLGAPTTGGLKGTLAYMAPEQLRGDPVDQRTDLYCAGLVAYEVLTGVPARPAGMAGLAELIAARATLPTPPSAIRAELDAALDAVVLSALAPAAQDRPSDVLGWLEGVLAAAGRDPDPGALGVAARAVPRGGLTISPSLAKTAAPSALAGPAAEQPIRRGRAWILALIAVVAIGGAFLAGRPDEAPTEPTAAPAAVMPSAAIQARTVRPGHAGQPAARLGMEESAPLRVAARPVEAETSAASRRAPEIRGPSAPRPVAKRPEPPTARPVEPRPAAPAPIRIEVRSGRDGPVHVSGSGTGGLAPRTTRDLGEGAHVIRLVGGSPALKPVVRLTRRGDRLFASIGAPSGRFYRVRCGGGAERDTPVRGLALKKALSCRLTEEGGGALSFGLRRMAP